MYELFDYAPNIHPMIVHFPIAILTLAIGLNLVCFFVSENWWDEKKTTFIYVLGSIASIVTYFSGRSAADTVFLPTEAQSILTNHADWALWTVLFFSIYALIRVFVHWIKAMDKKVVQIILFVIGAFGLLLLFRTGEYGATMVYGYGVGTGQYLEIEEPLELLQKEKVTSKSTFVKKENGDWSWEMSLSSIDDLINHFHWLEGSTEQLNPIISSTNYTNYLSFNPPRLVSNLFVTHSGYKNVQVDVYLDLSSFDGEVQIVHHVQDVQNYDFVALTSDGQISQGRITNGKTDLFAEKDFQNDGLKFIRVVGDGTHFRGYIDKEMAVHGHGDEPKAGGIGLKINGEGQLLIQKIEISQLK